MNPKLTDMNRNIIAGAILCAMSGLCAHAETAANWMNRLDDDAYVHQLSVPGTHDAATGNGTVLDSFARTQQLSLSEQFNAGVRAFDLRPSVSDGTLKIYHGIIATNITFDDALSTLCERLDENPSEFIIVVIRHEDDHENVTEKSQWGALLSSTLAQEKYAGRFIDFSGSLTVGDVRGKILLLSRDRYDTKPVGGFISGWSHSADFADQGNGTITGASSRQTTRLYMQDFYEVKGDSEKKLTAIRTLLDYSVTLNTATTSHIWVMNNTSGYSTTGLIATADAYRTNAASTNIAVADYLAEDGHAGPTGIMMMDFAGTDSDGKYDVNGQKLLEALIDNNFRYTMRGKSAGVNAVTGAQPDDISISADGVITASGPIRVYGISGNLVASGNDRAVVSQQGVYIVKTDRAVRKMVVR